MFVYPLVVVLVCAAFGFIVFRQYVHRRRPHQLVWTVSLGLGFLAGLFYMLFLESTHNLVLFKLYYICGALLMAAYLGLGSIFLLAPTRVAKLTAMFLVASSALGIAFLVGASIDPVRLSHAAHHVGPGTAAILPGPWKPTVALFNIFGSIAVIGGAVYSGVLTLRHKSPIVFFWANSLIAAGTLLAGAAGTVADQGAFAGSFWLLLALGFVVLFSGFLLTTRGGIHRPSRVADFPVSEPS